MPYKIMKQFTVCKTILKEESTKLALQLAISLTVVFFKNQKPNQRYRFSPTKYVAYITLNAT